MNCPTQELLDFLLSSSTIIPETLNAHAKGCSIYKRILNNKKLQKLFVYSLTCEETFGDKLRKGKARKDVEVNAGQLWLMKVPNSKKK